MLTQFLIVQETCHEPSDFFKFRYWLWDCSSRVGDFEFRLSPKMRTHYCSLDESAFLAKRHDEMVGWMKNIPLDAKRVVLLPPSYQNYNVLEGEIVIAVCEAANHGKRVVTDLECAGWLLRNDHITQDQYDNFLMSNELNEL